MCDEVCLRCTELFLEEHKVGAAGGPCSSASHRAHLEGSYQKKAEQALVNDTCFKLVLVSAFESTLMEKRSRWAEHRRFCLATSRGVLVGPPSKRGHF